MQTSYYYTICYQIKANMTLALGLYIIEYTIPFTWKGGGRGWRIHILLCSPDVTAGTLNHNYGRG